MMPSLPTGFVLGVLGVALPLASVPCQAPPGEGPAIPSPRITQRAIVSGTLNLRAIRAHGLRMFATPFNKHDGYGDGPMNPASPTLPGGRPTLQNNGTSLRVNGLDAQTCMECHSILSAATVPFRFGIGGIGGANNNAMAGPTQIDVDDSLGNGYAAFNGRFINPPFLLGSGGVELVGKEMTADLQRLKQQAMRQPGTRVQLVTKGVDFGVISYTGRTFITTGVEGVDEDLVVRPFGRKGEFATTRAFDIEAMNFHFGMQPVEDVGAGVDEDGDGVVDEVLIGELSALAIFNTNLERPVVSRRTRAANRGDRLFNAIGCADCHVPEITTERSVLTYSFPEVETDPSANVFYAVDLSHSPAGFDRVRGSRGLRVPMFSDLKRHDMGRRLAESTGGELDPFFITARLWGVADTAPYLHDGRALTLTDAILAHGGEAQTARDNFAGLARDARRDLLAFLRTLRTPTEAAGDLRLSDGDR